LIAKPLLKRLECYPPRSKN